MICPKCQSENKDSAKFCNECGHSFASASKTISLPTIELEAVHEGLQDVVSTQIQTRDNETSANSENNSAVVNESTGKTILLTHENTQDDSIQLDSIESDELCKTQEQKNTNDTIALNNKMKGLDVSAEEPDVLYSWEKGGTIELPIVSSDNEQIESRTYLLSNEDSQKTFNKKPLFVALFVVIVALLLAFGTWYTELWGGYRIPDVVSMDTAEATKTLEDKGFTVVVQEVKSDDDEGIVLLTDPAAGTRAEQGTSVVLHVSIARTVPSLLGLSADEAQDILSAEGFTNVTVKEEKSDEEENLVLSVNPTEGEKVKAAAPIELIIAIPYKVPSVSSLSLDDASKLIEAEGLTYTTEKMYTEDYTPGTVVSSSPESGSSTKSTQAITLYIAASRSQELIDLSYSVIIPGETLTISNTNYLVSSINSITYEGSDIVSFSIQAQPYTSFFGETFYASTRTVTGEIAYTSDNTISAIR